MKCPFGILENVCIRIGDFYMLDDFIVLYMAVNAYAHIILGRLFLPTSNCKVDVKGWRLTFAVGGNHVEFVLFENQNIPAPLSALEDVDFHEISWFGDCWGDDPFAFEYVTSEGLGLDYARMEFSALMPSSMI